LDYSPTADKLRKKLLNIFDKHPTKSYDGWHLFRMLDVPYSSVMYFSMTSILGDLSMEGLIEKKAGMWKVSWVGKDIAVRRCLDCGFEQSEKNSPGPAKCKNCGGSDLWGETKRKKVKKNAEDNKEEGHRKPVPTEEVQKTTC